VALPVAGLDALRVDRELGARFRRVAAVQVGAALELAELPGHLGGHRVPGDEADPRVGGVEDVVARQLAGAVRGYHAWSLLAGGGVRFGGPKNEMAPEPATVISCARNAPGLGWHGLASTSFSVRVTGKLPRIRW